MMTKFERPQEFTGGQVVVKVEGANAVTPETCVVIAEAGANHNNSIARAVEMAQKAKAAGAWGIKYQLYKAETLAVKESPKYWVDGFGTKSQYEAFKLSDHLPYSAFTELADECRRIGIVFFATPFDFPAVEALEAINTPIYKVASGDITHKPLLQAVAQTGKPVILSTGAATLEEIRDAVEWLNLGPDKLILLACTLTYPTPDPDGNFARLTKFRSELAPYLTGMSDHTIGVAGAWMTAALGGVCIEKHYTIDKSLPDVPDHAMSVDEIELAEMVDACRRAALLRGSDWIGVRDSEIPARENARRSIVFGRDMKAGERVRSEDLEFKRPGTGMAPSHFEKVVGRRLSRDVPREGLVDEDTLSAKDE